MESFGDGNVAALMKPYVETHPIGLLWVALWVITAVIELAGAPGAEMKRPRRTWAVVSSCVSPSFRPSSCSGLPKDRADG